MAMRSGVLTFFFATLQGQVEALALPPELERALVAQLTGEASPLR